MDLEFVPLLQVQRDLYRVPRGRERFGAYLRSMLTPDGKDLRLPLVAMNPMARDHVPALLDDFLALAADEEAARTVNAALPELADVPGFFKVGLVVADDLKGGWTNRYATEFTQRFENAPLEKRGWLVGLLWSSEPASLERVREEVRTTLHRAAYVLRQGPARTLRERMAQEGQVMALAGCTQPILDGDDLDYTREVLTPFLDATDMRTTIECLYGDNAARTLGFSPQGLSDRAGLALALHNAHQLLTGGKK
jgi:hypothetical protein